MSDYISEIKRFPKISIITPSFNSAKFIDDCIQSVVNQRYPSYEHVIVDGGSTDNTLEILKKYPHLKWMSEKDEGVYDAMNKGIKLSTGQIIGILNSDDYYESNIFETVANVFEEHRDVGVLHGNMKVLYNNNQFVVSRSKEYQKYYCMWVKHATCFIRKDVYDTFGMYDIRFKIQADFDLMLRYRKRGVKLFRLNRVISNFRVGGLSTKQWSLRESVCVRKRNGYFVVWAVISAIVTRTLFGIKLIIHK